MCSKQIRATAFVLVALQTRLITGGDAGESIAKNKHLRDDTQVYNGQKCGNVVCIKLLRDLGVPVAYEIEVAVHATEAPERH